MGPGEAKMTYVPRSPRRATRLSAVVDDGAQRAAGRVRNMSTSGIFVEAAVPPDGRLHPGRRVAVVPLLGDLHGERLPAEVTRVGDRGVAIRFLGLDVAHRQHLRQIFHGDARAARRARDPLPRAPLPTVPADAPVVLLTAAAEEAVAERVDKRVDKRVDRRVDKRVDPLGDNHIDNPGEVIAELEMQLLNLGRRNGELADELREARAIVEDLLRGEDALVQQIQRLERRLASRR